MERREEIQEKANELYHSHTPYEATIAMAEWADKTMINRICEWLENHAWEYIETKTVGIDEIYKGFDSETMICEFSSWYKKKGINKDEKDNCK